MGLLQSCLGAVAIPALAFAISESHRAVSWRRVFAAMALTVVLTALLLRIPALRAKTIVSGTLATCTIGAIVGALA